MREAAGRGAPAPTHAVSDAQIVSVDRRAVSTLTLATLRQLLKADDGRVVLMETSRAGAMRTVALRLRRLV